MAYLPDKSSEPVADLPNPKLNPLLNPTLGRHLGQWAHVYFTTPAEKRDEAIHELLRALEDEDLQEENENTVSAGDTLTCRRCGYRHGKAQNFCGMCGARMQEAGEAREPASSSAREDYPEEYPRRGQSTEQGPREGRLGELLVPRILLQDEVNQQPDSTGSLPSYYPKQAGTASTAFDESTDDIDWLRTRSLMGDSEPSSASGALKFALALVVLVVAAGLFYLQYEHPRNPASSAPRERAEQTAPASESSGLPISGLSELPPATTNDSAASAPKTPDAAGTPATQPAPQARAAETAEPPTHPKSVATPPPSSPPASEAPPAGQQASAGAGADNGSEELKVAEYYLAGKGGARNSAEASQYLWKAVSKQNTTALLMLSDLYAAGDGVARSCDEARLLLDAAARRNIPQAGTKLRLLRSSCP